jgi:hypothetical protein
MDASSNIPLKVPFNEKDQAKAMGARWNAESKHWYVPQGVDAAPFEKWLVADGSAVQAVIKPVSAKPAVQAKPVVQAKSSASIDDDIDDINAMLRDAVESFEDRY